MYSWIELSFLLATPALVLGIVLINRSVRFPRGMQRNCWCGRCGYELRSLEQQVCPECGVAHVITGVLTPGLLIRQRGSYFLLWAGWTALFLFVIVPVASLTLVLAAAYFNVGSQPRLKVSLQVDGVIESVADLQAWENQARTARPPLSYPIMLRYDATAEIEDSELVSGQIELRFPEDPASPWMVIDLVDQSWHLSGPQADVRGAVFERGAIAALYAGKGFDVESDVRASEIDSLFAVISRVVDDPVRSLHPASGPEDPVQYYNQSSGSSTNPMPPLSTFGIQEASMALGLVGYVLGLVILVRWRGRLLRQTAIH